MDYSFYINVSIIFFRIELIPGKKPVSAKERQVPYAIRNGVASEIRRMIQEGILEKVVQVDWVSPIVITKKKNGISVLW